MNVVEIGTGIVTLATSDQARSQLWNQLTATVGQVAAGDAFVIGQIAGNLVPFGAAAKIGKTGGVVARTDGLWNKASDLGGPVRLATPSTITSVLDWIKGAGSTVTVVATLGNSIGVQDRNGPRWNAPGSAPSLRFHRRRLPMSKSVFCTTAVNARSGSKRSFILMASSLSAAYRILFPRPIKEKP
ncbi:hypothetical protein [Microbacterium resistens]|uniref:hypothetical protein n=1 Tax=Microbacterium resistens TaxID=156977 RepID=UPI00286ABAC1|nr:hypothetical protein [Microbacterium resistens]